MKLRMTEESFDGIHRLERMNAGRKSRSNRHNGITLCIKPDLKWFCIINLHHEITALRTRHHLQRRSLKSRNNLCSGEIKRSDIWLGKADTAYILYSFIRSLYDASLYRHGNGK